MKIKHINLRNFRRLEDVSIDLEDKETIFVGPNNSGKTSATAAFRLFLVRPEFKVYDFSVSRIAKLNAFGFEEDENEENLPVIEMDLWFSIDPEIEFGRVFSLVPNISADLDEVGVRLRFCVKDAKKLKADFLSHFPKLEGELRQKTLSHFLSLHGNLNRHFGLSYFSLQRSETGPIPKPLEPEEGKRVLQSLVRVDFVDAQRNIDDYDIGRSTRLSDVFAAFYRKNLEQAEVSEDANRIIDENNDKLTQHYEQTFTDLLEVIQGLGVPSVNDRQMRILSSLSPEVALKGKRSVNSVPKLRAILIEVNHSLYSRNEHNVQSKQIPRVPLAWPTETAVLKRLEHRGVLPPELDYTNQLLCLAA